MIDEQAYSHIEDIRFRRDKAHRTLLKKSPVYKAFTEMESLTFQDGELSKKIKELIAIGISISINCESCMEWHIRQALKSGASEAEIMEAVGTAIEMGGGPATANSRFALDVIQYYKEAYERGF